MGSSHVTVRIAPTLLLLLRILREGDGAHAPPLLPAVSAKFPSALGVRGALGWEPPRAMLLFISV